MRARVDLACQSQSRLACFGREAGARGALVQRKRLEARIELRLDPGEHARGQVEERERPVAWGVRRRHEDQTVHRSVHGGDRRLCAGGRVRCDESEAEQASRRMADEDVLGRLRRRAPPVRGDDCSGVGLELMERVRVPVPRLGRPAAPHIVEGDDFVPRSRKVRDLSKGAAV